MYIFELIIGYPRTSFKAENSALVKTAEKAFDPWGVVLNGIGTQNGAQNRWEHNISLL